jgi:hypothetical protein
MALSLLQQPLDKDAQDQTFEHVTSIEELLQLKSRLEDKKIKVKKNLIC